MQNPSKQKTEVVQPKQKAEVTHPLGVIIHIEPIFVDEKIAAKMLDESYELRRRRRYEDEARLARYEPMEGPPWLKDGARIKYSIASLREYALGYPDIRTKFNSNKLSAKGIGRSADSAAVTATTGSWARIDYDYVYSVPTIGIGVGRLFEPEG